MNTEENKIKVEEMMEEMEQYSTAVEPRLYTEYEVKKALTSSYEQGRQDERELVRQFVAYNYRIDYPSPAIEITKIMDFLKENKAVNRFRGKNKTR